MDNDPDINFGSIYENFVVQELHAHGFGLYYFNSKKQGEVDFLIERSGSALPIEVKSGKAYQRHRALSNIIADNSYHIREALVLSGANVSTDGVITYLPIYMLMFLHQEAPANLIYKVDLPKL